MWLFAPFGFFSIVQAHGSPGVLQVRARRKEHLEALRSRYQFKAPIRETKDTDYQFRVLLNLATVIRLVTEVTKDITYVNFKEEATKVAVKAGQGAGARYVHALHDIWDIAAAIQPDLPYSETWGTLPKVRHGYPPFKVVGTQTGRSTAKKPRARPQKKRSR